VEEPWTRTRQHRPNRPIQLTRSTCPPRAAAGWPPSRTDASVDSTSCGRTGSTRIPIASTAPTRSPRSDHCGAPSNRAPRPTPRCRWPVGSCCAANKASSSSPPCATAATNSSCSCPRAVVGDDAFADIGELDLGDWVGLHGTVMTTRKGELSVKVQRLELLAKAVRPMPDKWHGLTDPDTRFRQRYADLIVNAEARRAFEIRHEVIASFRRTLAGHGLHRGGDPGAARGGGRRARPAVRHPPQRPRHAALLAHRAGAPPQAAHRGWDGAGVRDRPRVPQRGDQHPAQPRVHDDGALPGLR
jgi:hypothetical protein